VRIQTRLICSKGHYSAYLNCPKRGEEINMLTCIATEIIEGKDGIKSLDWECKYFMQMEIGAIRCSHPNRLPRHAKRPIFRDKHPERKVAVLV